MAADDVFLQLLYVKSLEGSFWKSWWRHVSTVNSARHSSGGCCRCRGAVQACWGGFTLVGVRLRCCLSQLSAMMSYQMYEMRSQHWRLKETRQSRITTKFQSACIRTSICENLRFCTVELLAFFVNGIFFFGFIGFISPLLLSNTSSGRS